MSEFSVRILESTVARMGLEIKNLRDSINNINIKLNKISVATTQENTMNNDDVIAMNEKNRVSTARIIELEGQVSFWKNIAIALASSGRCHASEECDNEPALKQSCTWHESYNDAMKALSESK